MASYDFKALSYLDFEDLARDLLQKEWGKTLESFKPGMDGGIDFRHMPADGTKTIVQCKHFIGSGYKALLNKLKKEELPKIKKLTPERYVLVTSVPLSPANKKAIQKALTPYVVSQGDIFGQDDLNNLLGKFPEIETKNFKLWLTSQAVLNRILHNASIMQSEFEVEEIAKKIPIYVQNDSLPDAMKLLDEYRFVIISGAPGIGKTTLAEMLIYQHLEHDYVPIVVDAHDVKAAFDRFDRNQPQFFYFDDFLGQTFVGDTADNINDQTLIRLIRMVKGSKNAKLIMTTREYILQNALKTHEKLDTSDLMDVKYVLELEKYTQVIRARILYNHLYFSDLDRSYLKAIAQQQAYQEIIAHKNYNPRIIEWMTMPKHVGYVGADDYPALFLQNLDEPEKLWEHAFTQQISFAAQMVLWALLSNGWMEKKDALKDTFERLYEYACAKYNRPKRSRDFLDALKELDGSFITIHLDSESETPFPLEGITFHNPSIRDYLELHLCANPEYALDIFQGALKFDQIVHIWDILKKETEEDFENYINLHQAEILESITRLSARPHGKLVKGEDHVWRFETEDIAFCKRIPLLYELGKITEVPAFHNLIIEMLEAVEFIGGDTIGNWADMVNLQLPRLSKKGRKAVIRKIISFTTKNASQANWLEEIENLLELDIYHDLDEEGHMHIQDAFQNLDVENEVSQISSTDELDDYMDKYKNINSDLGWPLIEVPSNYQDKYDQLYYEEENATIVKSDWTKQKQKRQKQEQEDQEVIDDMFSTLGDE